MAGVWDFEQPQGEEAVVKLLLFGPAQEVVLEGIRREACRVGRFIAGAEVRLMECASMTPLTQRTGGGFMSPLRGC